LQHIIEVWPETVRKYIQNTYGATDDVTPLSGLSQNHIWRLCFGENCIVLKQSAEAKEFRFYRDIAPQLVIQDMAIPALLWAEQVDSLYWTILEYMPKPFPRERWLADPAQLRLLRHLHQSQISLSSETDWLFRPLWDDAMTEATLSFFEADIAHKLRPLLQTIQAHSQPLFERECWISGDPNPMNWGLRDDDTLVLFDWERFGRGTPALDLAIATPGMAMAEDCHKVAAGYLESGSNAIELLARQIAQAKVWNVIEFLSMAQAGDVAEMRGVESLVNRTPAWLESISPYASS
jgi:aminoglycoside phosphotransferase (APT) family kinase protein